MDKLRLPIRRSVELDETLAFDYSCALVRVRIRKLWVLGNKFVAMVLQHKHERVEDIGGLLAPLCNLL